jgi:hypothetical protein
MFVASSRHANGCLWAFLGFLLGPLGLAMAFASESGRKCPHCRSGVSPDATRCPKCQGELSGPPAAETGSAKRFRCPSCKALLPPDCRACPGCMTRIKWPEAASTTKPCPFCAETILAAAKKCKHCGEFLEQAKTKNEGLSPAPEPKSYHCTGCRAPLENRERECPRCGARIEWPSEGI